MRFGKERVRAWSRVVSVVDKGTEDQPITCIFFGDIRTVDLLAISPLQPNGTPSESTPESR